ncbi:MAG: hypothetical protein HQM08_19040 [Candidatus Riflebacteria bacterium]|nr:hypothetical protein [Candidatus Riflebacteria bacterium]
MMKNKSFSETAPIEKKPGAVERLGLSTFAVMDAFPLDPAKVEVIYVQTEILSEYLGKPLDDEQAKAFVRQYLLLTLDSKEGIPGAKPVKVYVDRQADPLNISLVGNIGSGRAVYVGDCFNLKGIGKTVLATSKDPERSNGVLDLVGSLWEMICSNVLRTNLQTGASPTLAVIDLKKNVKVPWFSDTIPSGMIIRVDGNGELDRPSHLFFHEQPVSAERMLQIADRFGAQDAEKFIERILHGGWSAGNISVNGCLIDYDSVFAIRGRAPQWSFRPNWLSNFFGLEELGQKELLKALSDNSINVDHVSFEKLVHRFNETKQTQLEQRFLDLIGISPVDHPTLFSHCSSMLPNLVKQFKTLAMKMYPNFQGTAPWSEANNSISVYDLSRFFRLYPIARMSGSLNEKSALNLIRNPLGKMVTSRETQEGGMPDNVMKQLLEFAVTSPECLAATDRMAQNFAKSYGTLIDTCLAASFETQASKCQIACGKNINSLSLMAARAYVVNEERTYMNSRPGHDILIALVQNYKCGNITPRHFFEMLKLIIEACDRIPRKDPKGSFQADLRLSWNGYTSNLIGPDGTFQPRLTLLQPSMVSENFQCSTMGTWELEIDHRLFPCTIEEKDGRFHIIGPSWPLVDLLLGPPEFRFQHQGELFTLSPIFRRDHYKTAMV